MGLANEEEWLELVEMAAADPSVKLAMENLPNELYKRYFLQEKHSPIQFV